MAKTETYKGFTIAPCYWGWKVLDADGDVVLVESNKSKARGGISAIVKRHAWMIQELHKQGYDKIPLNSTEA